MPPTMRLVSPPMREPRNKPPCTQACRGSRKRSRRSTSNCSTLTFSSAWHGLIGKAHGGLGTLPVAERVEMLEFLVNRRRLEGKGESLDQIIEQVLWEMRRDGEVGTVHRAADAERDAATVAMRRAPPPLRNAWRGPGVNLPGGGRKSLASDATSRTGATKRSSTKPATKRAPAGTRSLPASPQQRKDRGRPDRPDVKETDLLLNVINKWRRPTSVHPHSTPSSPDRNRDRDRARTSRTPTKPQSLAKSPSLSPKEQAAVDRVLRLWKIPTVAVPPSITTSRHDSDASLPHSRLVSIGPSRAVSRSPSSRAEPPATDYAALMQSAHALQQPAALAKMASASGYLIPAAPPSPPAVTLHVPTVSTRMSRSVSRDLPALRITDEGGDEQGKGKGSSAAALSAIQQWKSRIKQMKKVGLGEPADVGQNPRKPGLAKDAKVAAYVVGDAVEACQERGSRRDELSRTCGSGVRRRRLSLVPKFHPMMQADRDRRERHHQEYVAMLQTQLTPFKFEYSETLNKREKHAVVLVARKAAIRARLAARNTTTPFPGLEAHQRLLEDRKR
ncbi:hypothetical protein AMAG_13007 [Allomyces macrogynus ATCC 38327]|uniref:Uncharacterized protein n=1 Tax=Allomyces macrogynus (strain ATCC 38327) TaxID=578462 RepID=A0A0L0T173_ALLM3|nr:hypothetical protein AMAG_13007 [Allomyces macrogynus ATCC 38327]|eukprot:KNE68349.1 hypothetical protein AMAG_13007 [Allomyces macrogynus ATCC 38327]